MVKQELLVFAAGLVAGVAIGLLVARGDDGSADEGGREGGSERRLLTGGSNAAGSKSGGRDDSRLRKAGARREGWQAGQPKAEFMDYLAQMKDIDGMQEINFLELIRHGHQITMLSEEKATAMLAIMEQQSAEEGDDGEFQAIAFALVFARFAELNGPAAMHYALTLEDGVFSADVDDLMTVGMSSWAEADPAGAADWFRDQAEGGAEDEMRQALRDEDVQSAMFAALAQADPDLARGMILEGTGMIQDDVVELVARRETSVEGLRELLDHTPEDDWKARHGIVAEWSRRDGAAAADWLDQQQSSNRRGHLVIEVGREFIRQDPEAGSEWMMRQELPAENQESRLSAVTYGLAAKDVAAAGDWLGQQENGPARDSSERLLAARYSDQQNWDEAYRWAADIENKRDRQRAVQQVIGSSWDVEKQEFRGNSLEAARAAGFAEDAEALRRKALGQ